MLVHTCGLCDTVVAVVILRQGKGKERKREMASVDVSMDSFIKKQ